MLLSRNTKKMYLNLILFASLVRWAQGTLTSDGQIWMDCGSKQTFTCNVSHITTGDSSAGWTITLHNIYVTEDSGKEAERRSSRISTSDSSGVTKSSTITITGFTTSDDRGAIQCIDLDDGSLQGMANISVEPPSCPANFSVNRDGDFTSATVTHQLSTPPPVTSTTVTYCPTSSPNCGNSMNCTTGPFTIIIGGLDPCVEYSLSAIPNNNCGSATGCTGNSRVVPAKGVPSCPVNATSEVSCSDWATVTWQQPKIPPVTFTIVRYCPTSSPNCENNMICTTSPCTISGLDPGTEYQFTVIPNNNCGSPTGCTENMATSFITEICSPDTTPITDSTLQTTAPISLIIGVVLAVVVLLAFIIATILICCFCLDVKGCKSGSDAKNKPLREKQPCDDYAYGITYAAL